jgi:hypothetical protein
MKKLSFSRHIMPHAVAIVVFLLVTVIMFSPVFFEGKKISQHDILQYQGASKVLHDYRQATGKEALWCPSMFSGMPAYLIGVQWGNQILVHVKTIISLNLPSPLHNIFLCFLCYYVFLLTFGIRPYLAIAGAVAFGLSTYIIIGMAAGHNARIGAIAFMPLVLAGIHLGFQGKRILGFGVTALALALHLRENHLQITYYLLLITLAYGLVELIFAWREKKISSFFRTLAFLIPAALLAAGSVLAPLWAIREYSRYSIRGKSELQIKDKSIPDEGLTPAYAFEYSNGILEPFTLLVPNIYGGSSMNNLFADDRSHIRAALREQGIEYNPQQMFQSAYWGDQPLSAPYYAGAVIVFLAMAGLWLAGPRILWWLVPLSIFAIVLSWGNNLAWFNNLVFQYLPGYNKFRSVTFALIIPLFAMPLVGMLTIERLLQEGHREDIRKKLRLALYVTGGLCLLLFIASGFFSYLRENESNLPGWYAEALRADRRSLLRSDTVRPLFFIVISFALLYFESLRKRNMLVVGGVLFLIVVDLVAVNKRYFSRDNYVSRKKQPVEMSGADRQVLADTTYFRVLNLNGPMNEALTSYFHHSIGGYHGAKIRRYQDLYDSCITRDIEHLIRSAQQGSPDYKNLHVLNMLNTRYIFYGNNRSNVLFNPEANGPAWFVRELIQVQSATEELQATCQADTRNQAVIDRTKFSIRDFVYDSTSSIALLNHEPDYLVYRANTSSVGLAVFSEIYYPEGWEAFINGSPAPILRVNYVLRALFLPEGESTIEFRFRPRSYYTGNNITRIFSWLVLLAFVVSLAWHIRKTLLHK